YGADPPDLATVGGASHLLAVHAAYRPGRPPAHEWSARAVAGAVGAAASAPVIDVFTPQILGAAHLERSLPGPDGAVRLTDWVLLPHTAAAHGLRAARTADRGRPARRRRTVGPPPQRPRPPRPGPVAGRAARRGAAPGGRDPGDRHRERAGRRRRSRHRGADAPRGGGRPRPRRVRTARPHRPARRRRPRPGGAARTT